MNDDFLHRVRKEPRPEFLRSLKERLDRIDGRTPTPLARSRSTRTLFAGIFIGASALALASLALKVDFAGVRGMLSRVMPLSAHHEDDTARVGGDSSGGSGELAPSGRASRGLRTPWTTASQPGRGDENAPGLRGKRPSGSGTEAPSGAPSLKVDSAPASYVVGNVDANAPRNTLKIVATAEIEPEIRTFAERLVHNGGPFGTLTMPDLTVADDAAAFEALCGGSGLEGADIIGVTRRITPAEAQACAKAKNVPVEIPIGYQAVVILRNRLNGAPNLTSRDLFLALANRVPDPASEALLQPNTYIAWNQFDPAQAYDLIHVIGPPLRSVGGRGLLATIMKAGCRKFALFAAEEQSNPVAFERVCTRVRTTGSYYEEADYGPSRPRNAVPSILAANPGALGVVGYMTYEALTKADPGLQVQTIGGVVLAGTIDGIEPTRDTIAAGTYPGSRTMYLYVNRARTQPSRDLQPIRAQVEYFVRTFSFPDGSSNEPSLVHLPWEVDKATRYQALGKLAYTN